MIYRKSPREIAKMREAGRIVAEVLREVGRKVAAGVTTRDLEGIAEALVRARGGECCFKGYRGFPGSICTSVNEEVVHGIPDGRVLKEGDLVSVDVGVRWEGYIGDGAWTFPVGSVSDEARRLLDVGAKALGVGVSLVVPGAPLSEVSAAIQAHVEGHGFSVVRDYAGHGVGREMHEDPRVPNYVDASTRRFDVILRPGYCLAIEPMVNAGTHRVGRVVRQGWEVVVTQDARPSVHFEHTVVVTEDGHEVLTTPGPDRVA